MRALMSAVLAVLFVAPVSAKPSVRSDGDTWTLENKALRVEVDAASGTFEVLDRQAEYLWRGPDSVERPPALAIPKAERRLFVDRDLGEWVEPTAKVSLTPDMVADATEVDGADDLSATVVLLWDTAGLYMAVSVRDADFVAAAADEAQWWFKDTVEFWLGSTQYAIRFGEWGANVWSTGGNVEGAEVAFQRSRVGYWLEALIPAERLGEAATKGVGGRLRFAVGINDCDGDDGRQGQLYYPTTWAHSNASTFAQVVLADADGAVPEDGEAGGALELKGRTNSSVSFGATARTGGRELPVSIAFALEGDTPELLLAVDTEDRDVDVSPFTVLHPLVLDRPGGRILGARYSNGIGVPTDDLSWKGQQWTTFGSLDMPWVGLTDGTLGYMLLWELPVSCDNGAARFEQVEVGERTLLAPSVFHFPIKGAFVEPRTVRYSFTQDGGHVSICKRYRAYAKEHGFLVTQKEKLKRKPELAKLPGAPDIWGDSSLDFCREAKAAGMDRFLVNGAQPWDDMETIKSMGLLMSTYDNYEDAHEGDPGRYGDFDTDADVAILSDGSQMKAWLTHADPPKQFMKRCAASHERVARTWVPKELEKYPYNARFIDVTTATGLRECYSDTHGLTRTEDREVKRALARYVGEELNLVLGGEHGRWWGADLYDYWEGMQSGGFYSWPAGYVGEDLPETREDIGEQYLNWGLGETNRYPLWELVFHDCVVSTWYWGDSTGHLREVAPELGYKKDAFNILYGTVPLYWVSRPFSYRWDSRQLRDRLLESYRNTCKLHEAIAFEELVSHEFVTEDRAVQKTTFGDGTEVWVNFGEEPWELKLEGESYELPQYGFYAKGPKIEQYRAIKEWAREDYKGIDEVAERIGGIGERRPGSPVTYIRTPDYLYCSGDVPGIVESFLGMEVTARRLGPDRLLVDASRTKWARINVAEICPEAGEGDWRILELDSEGEPYRMGGVVPAPGGMLAMPAFHERSSVLLGPQALAGHAELSLEYTTPQAEAPPKQGDEIALQLTVTNHGGKPAKDVEVVMYQRRALTKLGSSEENPALSSTRVDVRAGESVDVPVMLDTTRFDGSLLLGFELKRKGAEQEICSSDNITARSFYIAPDWGLWSGHVEVTAHAGEVSREGSLARMPFDAQAEWEKLGREGEVDPESLRVTAEVDGEEKARFTYSQYGEGELTWTVASLLDAGQAVRCRIYMDSLENAERHDTYRRQGWREDGSGYLGRGYSVKFSEGYIRELSIPAIGRVIGPLGASSQDTGWVDEVGELESLEVLADGPVFTQVRVKKNLQGGHYYDKLYTFYPYHFEVTTLSEERFGIMSRAYYTAECQYEDDKGNTAWVDGKGDAEGISGKNPSPKWYATWQPRGDITKRDELDLSTVRWGITCVAMTPHENFTYWDGGKWGGIGFNARGAEPATVAYYIHRPQPGDEQAPDFAELDYRRAHSPVDVTRD